jgi:hypothetical protein
MEWGEDIDEVEWEGGEIESKNGIVEQQRREFG